MNLKKDISLIDLLRKSKLCKEDVLLKTDEGDVLNLKSFLSGLLLQSVAYDKSLMVRGYLECMNDDDYDVMAEFIER